VAAIVGVLSAGVLFGVVIGVALSLLWLIYVTTRPPMPLLGREAGTGVFRDLGEFPDGETFQGVVVVRLDGGLFFATAEALDDRVRQIVHDSSLRTLVLDLANTDFVDSQGSAKLAELHEFTAQNEITLRLARVKRPVLARLQADGVVDLIGADHLHPNVHGAVDASLGPGAIYSGT